MFLYRQTVSIESIIVLYDMPEKASASWLGKKKKSVCFRYPDRVKKKVPSLRNFFAFFGGGGGGQSESLNKESNFQFPITASFRIGLSELVYA